MESQQLNAASVLLGEKNGKYPDANAVLVHGGEESLLLDAPLCVRSRAAEMTVDRVALTHVHEDHVAALPLFRDAPCVVHEIEVSAMATLDAFLDLFGMPDAARERFATNIETKFFFEPRDDLDGLTDDEVFDLGGGVTVTALHTPGHTSGHTAFLVEPAGLLFLGDIDLSSFGPFYGDVSASVVDFERSIARVREIDCAFYLSGHHVGLLEGRAAFLDRLDRFAAKIADREHRLLAFLDQPRTLDEIATHRFVYRPQDDVPGAVPIEKKSMSLHLARLHEAGAVEALEDGAQTRWLAAAGNG